MTLKKLVELMKRCLSPDIPKGGLTGGGVAAKECRPDNQMFKLRDEIEISIKENRMMYKQAKIVVEEMAKAQREGRL